MKCCGWVSRYNWTENEQLRNSTKTTYPCSCEKMKEEDNQLIVKKGFCESNNGTLGGNNPEDWPVYPEGCMEKARKDKTEFLRERFLVNYKHERLLISFNC